MGEREASWLATMAARALARGSVLGTGASKYGGATEVLVIFKLLGPLVQFPCRSHYSRERMSPASTRLSSLSERENTPAMSSSPPFMASADAAITSSTSSEML